MIKVRKFKTCYVQVFNPDGSLFLADEYTFYDIRCQIREQKVAGYTYKFNEQLGIIDSKGNCSEWFKGMFDLEELFLSKLYRIEANKDLTKLNKRIDEMVDNSKMSNIILSKDNEVDVYTLNVINNE